MPNTRFLLHQPSGGVQRNCSDITIEAEEIIQRNFWVTAEEVREYGLVGSIIEQISEVE